MSSAVETVPTSRIPLWIGRILSTLVVLMLIMSAVMKFVKPEGFEKEFEGKFGFPVSVATPLGVVELVCTALYAIPQTSVLGAILLTGYLGGATATHVRVNDPFIAPIIIGMVVWGGLYLRDPRVRALLPFRR
jgi:hypothetical protein